MRPRGLERSKLRAKGGEAVGSRADRDVGYKKESTRPRSKEHTEVDRAVGKEAQRKP